MKKNLNYLKIRKVLFFCFCLASIILLNAKITNAQTPTEKIASASASPKEIIDKLKQIEQLKEKIATKVAQIRESEKGAYGGEITAIEKNSLTIKTAQGEKKITTSEDTIIYDLTATAKKETTADKLKKGQLVSVFGYFNEDKSIFSAKYVLLQKNFIFVSGKISEIDKNNFTITVKSKKNDYVIDFEKFTSTFLYDKEKKTLIKGGFSKLQTGNIIHLIAITSKDKENVRLQANRAYVIPLLATASANISPSLSPTLQPKSATDSTNIKSSLPAAKIND